MFCRCHYLSHKPSLKVPPYSRSLRLGSAARHTNETGAVFSSILHSCSSFVISYTELPAEKYKISMLFTTLNYFESYKTIRVSVLIEMFRKLLISSDLLVNRNSLFYDKKSKEKSFIVCFIHHKTNLQTSKSNFLSRRSAYNTSPSNRE